MRRRLVRRFVVDATEDVTFALTMSPTVVAFTVESNRTEATPAIWIQQ